METDKGFGLMRGFLSIFCAVALALFCLVPVDASAQDSDASELSQEELESLFLQQKSRGLVLAPTGTEQAAESVPVDEAAAPAPAADATYVELDKSEQVNIRIAFDFDSAALRDDQKSKLATLCEVINAIEIDKFRIVGHTDASGSAGYNQRLSLLRAEEVKRYLVSDCGIAENRLEAVGVGKDFLFDKDDPRSETNRRVEFQAMS
jgi:OOP family OmpA-OmpF porin